METPLISRPACPVCDLAREKSGPESANYRLCPSCHVIYRGVFQRAPPGEGWDATYYSDQRVRDYYSRRYSGFRKIVSLLDARVAKPGRWLDIGCGPGALLEVAREKGWQAFGIDPSAICVEIGRRRIKDAVITRGTVEEKLAEFEDMTVASFMNVLRCIENPGHILRALRHLLVEGGWVVIREENPYPERRRRANEISRVEVTSTMALQLWTPGALENALRRAGFRSVRSLPSPTFTETVRSEWKGGGGFRDDLTRFLKWGAWPLSRAVHTLSGGRTYLGPNFITLGQR